MEFGVKYWQFLLPIPVLLIAKLQELIVVEANATLICVGISMIIRAIWLSPCPVVILKI